MYLSKEIIGEGGYPHITLQEIYSVNIKKKSYSNFSVSGTILKLAKKI